MRAIATMIIVGYAQFLIRLYVQSSHIDYFTHPYTLALDAGELDTFS